MFSDLPESLREWVERQSSSSRIESIAMAHDAKRLAAACPDINALDRMMNVPFPVIDQSGSFTSGTLSGSAASVIHGLAESLLPKLPRVSDEAWASASIDDKLEHVRNRIREAVGTNLHGYYNDKDLRFIAANLATPNFQLLRDGPRHPSYFQI